MSANYTASNLDDIADEFEKRAAQTLECANLQRTHKAKAVVEAVSETWRRAAYVLRNTRLER